MVACEVGIRPLEDRRDSELRDREVVANSPASMKQFGEGRCPRKPSAALAERRVDRQPRFTGRVENGAGDVERPRAVTMMMICW